MDQEINTDKLSDKEKEALAQVELALKSESSTSGINQGKKKMSRLIIALVIFFVGLLTLFYLTTTLSIE